MLALGHETHAVTHGTFAVRFETGCVSGFTARLAGDALQADFLEPFLETFKVTEVKTPASGAYVTTRGARLLTGIEFELDAEARLFATLSTLYY